MTNFYLPLAVFVVAVAAGFLSCADESVPNASFGDESPSAELADADFNIHINAKNKLQKITLWGHDIKQGAKAENLTEEACRQIFEEGKFNLLRIPIYVSAHNADGSIRKDYLVSLEPTGMHGDKTKWKKVPAEDGWFYLRNKAHDRNLKGFDYSAVELGSADYQDEDEQWRLVDAGDGWYHIENRILQGYLRGKNDNNVQLADKTSVGAWARWRLVDAGNGYFYIENNGHKKHLKGGGNLYQQIIAAINRAKKHGSPDLYASHKIYPDNRLSFGSFYTDDGIDAPGFAAVIDAFIAYIYEQTGEKVKYLAPKCEKGNQWSVGDFTEVVANLNAKPLIVGPEAAWAVNSERDWTEEVARITDIKSTHNKLGAADWPSDAEFDWNGETIGGSKKEFFRFFTELNQSFYVGKVKGVVFWGDSHLMNTDDDNMNGPFRRALVKASANNLIECDAASYEDGAAAIAFATADKNEIKVFYTSKGTVRFTFNAAVKPERIPEGAFDITKNSFVMNATGKREYASFLVSF